MQEASKLTTVLQTSEHTEQFEKLFPAELRSLPQMMQASGVENGRAWQALHFGKRCDSTPTNEDILEVLGKIQSAGTPIGWLSKLTSINLPKWPEDKEPTVQEFFDGKFDPKDVTIQVLLISYPCYWVDEIKDDAKKFLDINTAVTEMGVSK